MSLRLNEGTFVGKNAIPDALKDKEFKALPSDQKKNALDQLKQNKSVTTEDGVEEGKLKNALTGMALFAALIAGNNAITNANPQMKSLKAAYEQAKDSGDEVKMKELKDKITKQTIFLDTGKGEPQSVKEIVKKCLNRGMIKENISKVVKKYLAEVKRKNETY